VAARTRLRGAIARADGRDDDRYQADLSSGSPIPRLNLQPSTITARQHMSTSSRSRKLATLDRRLHPSARL